MRAPRQPVYDVSWIRPGVHVTGLSSVRAEAREIADGVWAAADVVIVDDRGTVGQSGDGRSATIAGTIDLSTTAELFELVTGAAGRRDDAQVTLFKSAGNAMQDIAVAIGAYQLAVERRRGTDVGAFPEVKPYA
jgi:ornithine cyclodeaminase